MDETLRTRSVIVTMSVCKLGIWNKDWAIARLFVCYAGIQLFFKMSLLPDRPIPVGGEDALEVFEHATNFELFLATYL